jgi:hypothetical protein
MSPQWFQLEDTKEGCGFFPIIVQLKINNQCFWHALVCRRAVSHILVAWKHWGRQRWIYWHCRWCLFLWIDFRTVGSLLHPPPLSICLLFLQLWGNEKKCIWCIVMGLTFDWILLWTKARLLRNRKLVVYWRSYSNWIFTAIFVRGMKNAITLLFIWFKLSLL